MPVTALKRKEKRNARLKKKLFDNWQGLAVSALLSLVFCCLLLYVLFNVVPSMVKFVHEYVMKLLQYFQDENASKHEFIAKTNNEANFLTLSANLTIAVFNRDYLMKKPVLFYANSFTNKQHEQLRSILHGSNRDLRNHKVDLFRCEDNFDCSVPLVDTDVVLLKFRKRKQPSGGNLSRNEYVLHDESLLRELGLESVRQWGNTETVEADRMGTVGAGGASSTNPLKASKAAAGAKRENKGISGYTSGVMNMGSPLRLFMAHENHGPTFGQSPSKQFWNEVIEGAQHWVLFPPDNAPPNGFRSHESLANWVKDVYPGITAKFAPKEVVVRPGQVLYVPEGWFYAYRTVKDGGDVGVSGTCQSQDGEDQCQSDRTNTNTNAIGHTGVISTSIQQYALGEEVGTAFYHLMEGRRRLEQIGDANGAIRLLQQGVEVAKRDYVRTSSAGSGAGEDDVLSSFGSSVGAIWSQALSALGGSAEGRVPYILLYELGMAQERAGDFSASEISYREAISYNTRHSESFVGYVRMGLALVEADAERSASSDGGCSAKIVRQSVEGLKNKVAVAERLAGISGATNTALKKQLVLVSQVKESVSKYRLGVDMMDEDGSKSDLCSEVISLFETSSGGAVDVDVEMMERAAEEWGGEEHEGGEEPLLQHEEL